MSTKIFDLLSLLQIDRDRTKHELRKHLPSLRMVPTLGNDDNTRRSAGFEEPFVVYERARRQKHGPDHLSALETLVLRRVVDGTRVEQQTLRSQIRRSSLSRVLSRLSKRKLVKSTIDSRDRTSRLLFS